MKINLIIPSFYPATIYGGPIFSTLNTCKELSDLEGIEIFVSTTNANMTTRLDITKNTLVPFSDTLHVKYYNDTWINKLSLPLLFNLWRDIAKSDLVHIQAIFSTPTPIALIYAKLLNKPILLSPRGSFAPWILEQKKDKKKRWLKYIMSPFVTNINWHATSKQEKGEIIALFPEARVYIVPNGINLDEYIKINILTKKAYVKKYTKEDVDPDYILISMGRLHAKKGFDILIDAFHTLDEQFSNSILLIAGDDEAEKINLEKQIKKLGLDKKVFLIGSVSGQDKVDFLANADLFVLPSHNENFGNVYVESMAAGTPIVASTNTPWEEIEESNCGKWVNNNVEETKHAIMEMLEKDRVQMRVNSNELAKKYEWKNIATEFKQIFTAIINKKRERNS